ncbi:MAG: hypothetical protein U0527_08805 [Candidatus Eisenbacteria bacterium]
MKWPLLFLALVAGSARAESTLIPLRPELAREPYHLTPGPRPYAHRLAVSPSYGALGSSRLFALRIAYNPTRWLGYEAEIGHAPGHSAHSLVHALSLVLRRPLPGRVQPYLIGGYGMILVFPSRAENADSVTRNLLSGGCGLELYIRDDLALRGEWKQTTALSGGRLGPASFTYDYAEGTVGFSFQRRLGD